MRSDSLSDVLYVAVPQKSTYDGREPSHRGRSRIGPTENRSWAAHRGPFAEVVGLVECRKNEDAHNRGAVSRRVRRSIFVEEKCETARFCFENAPPVRRRRSCGREISHVDRPHFTVGGPCEFEKSFAPGHDVRRRYRRNGRETGGRRTDRKRADGRTGNGRTAKE